MLAANRRIFIGVGACIVIIAIWLAVSSKQQQSDFNNAAPEVAPAFEPVTDIPHAEHLLEARDEPERSKRIARKRFRSLQDDDGKSPRGNNRLTDAYAGLESPFSYRWRGSAFVVGEHGDPDVATEAIIDLIQNRESQSAENTKWFEGKAPGRVIQMQDAAYLVRLRILIPLGLTGTQRSEEFLLNAYKNPHDVEANRKYRQLSKEQRALGNYMVPSALDIDQVTSSYAIAGLILLDESKYSVMLDDEYDKMLPDVEKIYSKQFSQRTARDVELLGRFGTHVDVLVIRDMVRERGTENALYFMDGERFVSNWQRHAWKYIGSLRNSRSVQR